jgi:hypothetical protein
MSVSTGIRMANPTTSPSLLTQTVIQNSIVEGFTQKYYVNSLVWFTLQQTMDTAFTREKQLKNGIETDT